jgi:YggT family protein
LGGRALIAAPCCAAAARIEPGQSTTGTLSMAAIIGFVFFILNSLLGLLILALVITAILSWLVAFDVVNLRNPTMRQVYFGLERFVEPMLRPIRRFVPSLGGVDLSFLVLFLVIQGVQSYLLLPFRDWLILLVGG